MTFRTQIEEILHQKYNGWGDIQKEAATEIIDVIVKSVPEAKAELDKNDPENYEACFAIAGFNDCRNQVLLNLMK